MDNELLKIKKEMLTIIDNLPTFFKQDIEPLFKAPSKNLRAKLGILFQKAVFGELNDTIIKALSAIELAHNASLLHDDVIDEAEIRRNQPTLNETTNAKIAILAGDWIISQIMLILNDINNHELYENFANAIKIMSLGEIEQFYNKYKVPTIEQYYKKNEAKTGQLFKLAVIAPFILNEQKNNIDNAISFAKNFSNAFQIKDDIRNYFAKDNDKPVKNDEEQGIYTLPIILKNNTTNENLYEECCKILKHQVNLSIESLEFIEDNKYKKLIIELCNDLLRNI